MSVGNLKDYGNKGNNFPFQLKVLQGLSGIITSITNIFTNISSVNKVTAVRRVSVAGSIAAGASSVSIANVGAANGTVKTVIIKPGETLTFNAGALNNKLDVIDYVATGTEFLIITVV